MSNKVRVRFAPSPTGPLHIGGVRTALYNWLFARKNGGKFILRIEDTDRNRFVPGAEKYITESLSWCGITIDEGINEGGDFGPYRQSERREIYSEYVDTLLREEKAYLAFDTPEELDSLRTDYESRGETFVYNSQVRNKLRNSVSLGPDETSRLIEQGTPAVVRFRIDPGRRVIMTDLIRGDIHVETSTLDDKILMKADGMPTYHLANVVDDYLMKISHVIRGEEWLPSLPMHQLLYEAFGWPAPSFAHLPLLLKPTGKGKLSKRDGDKLGFPVFPLKWPEGDVQRGYREDGYFPEAFINMLALLGWNPGTEQEIFTMDELVGAFSLERVGRSGARFDPEKAKWFNHQYMQLKSNKDISDLFNRELAGKGINVEPGKLDRLVELVKERVSLLSDLWNETDFFFEAPDNYDEGVVKKRWKEDSADIMYELHDHIASMDKFESSDLEEGIKEWITGKGLGMGMVLTLLRLLLVGASRGPHLFDILEWLGKEESLTRIKKGIMALQNA